MPDEVTGATLDVQTGNRHSTPALALGDITRAKPRDDIRGFCDLRALEDDEKPAMLIGMDVLGLLDTLVIDYRRRELHVKLRRS